MTNWKAWVALVVLNVFSAATWFVLIATDKAGWDGVLMFVAMLGLLMFSLERAAYYKKLEDE